MPRRSRPRPVRSLLAAVGAVALLSLGAAACGSASDKNVSTADPLARTTTTLPGTTTTTAPTTSTSSAGGSPAGSGTTSIASGPVPPVTGATDLSKEPTVGPGTGTAPSVLTGADLVTGKGTEATATSSSVTVQYVGAIYQTGKTFDASWTDNGPATFSLSQVVPGFRDAIIGMKVGGRREVVIPPSLGYGAAGEGSAIPPNATLTFVIDLLAVGS